MGQWVSSYKRLEQIPLSAKADRLSASVVFPLIRHPTTNFYHWVTEYLPKLQSFERYSRNNSGPILLIESDPPSWVIESLKLMGIDPGQWLAWEHTAAYIDEILIPLHRSRTAGTPDIPSPDGLKYVRKNIIENTSSKNTISERVFISRQKADHRRIKNFDQINSILKEY
ncbi:MAG: DUF563 domain-containing protein, partial [Candidatus Paceibacteria bacterium]